MYAVRKIIFRNFQSFHWLSQWARYRFTPAGLLIAGGLVASGIFGIDTRQSLSFQIFAIMVSLLFISLLSAITFRGRFSLHRKLPDYGTATLPLKYKVLITNGRARQHKDIVFLDEFADYFPDFQEFIAVRDPQDKKRNWFDRTIGYPRLISHIRRKRGGSIPPVEVPLIPGCDQTEVEIEFIPLRRGYLEFAASRIARPDPFGLFRAIIKYKNPDSLLVLPKTYQLGRIQLPGKRRYQHGGLNTAAARGDSQEFLSLRDYQPGDPLRTIHWRSYAKRAKPIVKEFQDEFFVRQGLILDTFIEKHPNYVFEEAVSVAASIALSIKVQDSLLDLMFVGTDSYRFTAGSGFGKTENILEILACAQPCLDQSFEKLHELLSRHVSETSGLIFVLLDWDAKRKELIRQLRFANIPLIVFIVSELPAGSPLDTSPLSDTPQRLIPLPVDNIREALQNIDWEKL